jgi:hypothetical protein
VGTLLANGSGFDTFDAMLQLFLKGLLEKLASSGKEKVFHIVECFAVGGVIGDKVALVEESIEFRVKEFTTRRKGRCGGHKGTSV